MDTFRTVAANPDRFAAVTLCRAATWRHLQQSGHADTDNNDDMQHIAAERLTAMLGEDVKIVAFIGSEDSVAVAMLHGDGAIPVSSLLGNDPDDRTAAYGAVVLELMRMRGACEVSEELVSLALRQQGETLLSWERLKELSSSLSDLGVLRYADPFPAGYGLIQLTTEHDRYSIMSNWLGGTSYLGCITVVGDETAEELHDGKCDLGTWRKVERSIRRHASTRRKVAETAK